MMNVTSFDNKVNIEAVTSIPSVSIIAWKKNAKVGIRHFTAKRKLTLRNMSAISSKYASDLRKMSFERFWTENDTSSGKFLESRMKMSSQEKMMAKINNASLIF